MSDETHHLMKTLVHTATVIAESSPEDRVQILAAYREAQALAASIPKDGTGDARPRILACLRQFEIRRAAIDVSCAGWMLMAIQERVNEGDLSGWRRMRKAVERLVALLAPDTPALH